MTATWLGLFLLGSIYVFMCSLFLFICLFVYFSDVLALLQPPQLAVPASLAEALHS